MMWREQLRRAGRPVVLSVARALRGESSEAGEESRSRKEAFASDVQRLPPAVASLAEGTVEPEASSLPAWGILPSQIPTRVALLPGRSSIELLRRSRRIAGWFCALYAVAVATAFIVGGNPGAVALGAMIVLLLAGAVLGLLGPPSVERTHDEHRAGYTVWRRGTLWKPQVDAETGFVIRPAEAAGLSKQEEAAAQKRVREIARYLDER